MGMTAPNYHFNSFEKTKLNENNCCGQVSLFFSAPLNMSSTPVRPYIEPLIKQNVHRY